LYYHIYGPIIYYFDNKIFKILFYILQSTMCHVDITIVHSYQFRNKNVNIHTAVYKLM